MMQNAWRKSNGLGHFGKHIGKCTVMEAKEVQTPQRGWNRPNVPTFVGTMFSIGDSVAEIFVPAKSSH